MVNKVYNLFINSKNKNQYENNNNLTIYFSNDEIITLNNNEYINVNVVSFSMLNSIYNVSEYSGNNKFVLQEYSLNGILDIENNITIPSGNYSVLTLKDTLNNLLSNKINISYNTATNTYTYKKLNEFKKYYINPLKCYKLLGINDIVEITTNGINSSFVNMVDFQQVIIRSPTLNFENYSLDNIKNKSNFLTNSDILFWFNKQDIEPFKTINYRNEDCGTNFNYNLLNRYINILNFQIVNEYDEPINDCPDYLLQLQFTINEKNNDIIEVVSIEIIKILKDIQFILLNIINIFSRFIKK